CATRSTRIVSAVGSASGDRIVRRTACHASTNSCRLNDASVTAKVPPTTISSDGTLTNAAAEPPSQTATPTRPKPLSSPIRVARSTRAARRTLSPMSGGSAAACAATMGARRAIYTCSAAIRLDDLGHGHAEAIIDHHHLAARDQSVVYVDVDRLADLAVQLDHGATAELQQLADLHRRLAEHRRHLHRNVVDGIQIRGGPQPLILAVALAVLLERDRDRLSQLLEIETFLLRHPILHFARSRRPHPARGRRARPWPDLTPRPAASPEFSSPSRRSRARCGRRCARRRRRPIRPGSRSRPGSRRRAAPLGRRSPPAS